LQDNFSSLSGTSLAGHFRSVRRIRSAVDFILRISVAAEEAAETLFFVELLSEADLVKLNLLQSLMKECLELLRILSSSLATAKLISKLLNRWIVKWGL